MLLHYRPSVSTGSSRACRVRIRMFNQRAKKQSLCTRNGCARLVTADSINLSFHLSSRVSKDRRSRMRLLLEASYCRLRTLEACKRVRLGRSTSCCDTESLFGVWRFQKTRTNGVVRQLGAQVEWKLIKSGHVCIDGFGH